MNKAYYLVKPFLPLSVRLLLRQQSAKSRRGAFTSTWPIDERAGAVPPNWPGWPDKKQFAVVLTHDVEGLRGLNRVPRLMELERGHGFRSSFNFIPEGEYRLTQHMRHAIERDGFEVGVQDDQLYRSKVQFSRKAARIRDYLVDWEAKGFRSALIRHQLPWLHQLGAEYDSSTFDTDPVESESGGARTIFPFWTPNIGGRGYVELPNTLPQDFTLFVLLRESTIEIWKKKVDWIAAHGGMVLLNVHPDYMSFDGKPRGDEFPSSHYDEFLSYLHNKYGGQFWSALPIEVARFYCSKVPLDQRNTRRRICMVTHSVYEFDNRVRRYAETLAKQGDEVDVFAISKRDGEQVRTETISGVSLHRVQQRKPNEQSKWTYAYQLLRFLVVSSMHLTRHHHRTRYDLVHIHNMPDFIVFSAWYPKLTGAKLILDIHDLVPELFQNKFPSRLNGIYVHALKAIEKLSAGFVDHVIIANHLWKDTFVARSIPREKCSVVLNHVDPAIFHRRSRTRQDGNLVVIFPGTFQWHQGLDIGIRAFARVREQFPTAEFHLYGGGGGSNTQADLTQLVESLGLDKSVRFLGYLRLDHVPQVIANADIGVVPKRVDSFGNEAYSTKIMEFMSQGVPVVASRTKIDTFYFDESNVRFFTSGDDKEMADAMLDVIRHAELRNRLIENGLAYVEQNSWDRKKAQYLDLVDSLLANSPTSLHSCESLSVPNSENLTRRG